MHRGTRVLGMFIFIITMWGGVCPAQVDDARKMRMVSAVEDALKQKTLHSGTLDIFDKEGEKVRNLRLLQEKDNIVEEGGAFFLVFNYRDITAGDILKVDLKLTEGGKYFPLEGISIKDIQRPA